MESFGSGLAAMPSTTNSLTADIPFKGETFDLIGMFDVLEHVEQDVETLQALRGLLAPGARMLITVPAYPWMSGAHDVFLQHKRRYTAKSLRKTLVDAGGAGGAGVVLQYVAAATGDAGAVEGSAAAGPALIRHGGSRGFRQSHAVLDLPQRAGAAGQVQSAGGTLVAGGGSAR